jgi:hypothetical protein
MTTAKLAHAVLKMFHRFYRISKSFRARIRVVSFVVLVSSF